MHVDFNLKLSLSSFDLKHLMIILGSQQSSVFTVHDRVYLNLMLEYTPYFHKRELQSKFGGAKSPPD